MTGQFGSSRSLVNYETTSNTLSGGFNFKVASSFTLFANAVYNDADGSMDPFTISVTPDFNLDAKPNQNFDFSQTYLWSDLEISRTELEIGGTYDFSTALFITGAYRYIDLSDDAPYLVDVSGEADFYALSVGYRF